MSHYVTEHLEFQEVRDTGKTYVWSVVNRQSQIVLGVIRWYGGWRRYVFYPASDMVFDAKCLMSIVEFITTQMELRKQRARDVEDCVTQTKER